MSNLFAEFKNCCKCINFHYFFYIGQISMRNSTCKMHFLHFEMHIIFHKCNWYSWICSFDKIHKKIIHLQYLTNCNNSTKVCEVSWCLKSDGDILAHNVSEIKLARTTNKKLPTKFLCTTKNAPFYPLCNELLILLQYFKCYIYF